MTKLVRYFLYRLLDPSEKLPLILVFAIPLVITILTLFVFSPNLQMPILAVTAVSLIALLVRLLKDLVVDVKYWWRLREERREEGDVTNYIK